MEQILSSNRQVVTNLSLRESFDCIHFSGISLDRGLIIETDQIKKLVFTTYDHPYSVAATLFNSTRQLYINADYYADHPTEVDSLLTFLLKNKRNEHFQINDAVLIKRELIKSLANNQFLTRVTLAAYGENPYQLKKQDYLLFKKSNVKEIYSGGVEESLIDHFDPLIQFNQRKKIIGDYTIKNVKEAKKLIFDRPLREEELFYVKEIAPGVELEFHVSKDYTDLLATIRTIEQQIENKMTICLGKKEPFNKFSLELVPIQP